MKKRISLIISIICMIASISTIGGTVYYASQHQNVSVGQNTNGTPPQMPGNSQNGGGQAPNDSSNQQGSSSDSQSSQNNQTDQNGSQDSQSNQNGQNQDNQTNQNSPSSMPGQSQQNGMQPSNGQAMNQSSSLSILQIVLISVSSAVFMLALTYLIMSKAGTKTLGQTFSGAKPTALYAIINVIGTIGLVLAIVLTSNSMIMNSGDQGQSQITQIDSDGVVDLTNEKNLTHKTITSSSSDQSTITVSDGGSLTASSLKLKKTGDTSNTENSEFYGLNAGVLVQKGSSATIKDTTIETSASGANALFATGENAKITVSNTTIKTTGDSSRGLDATYGGTINANKVSISTQGSHCAALATDRGEGTITAKNSTLNTAGKGSPCIYSTGKITATNSQGLATNSSCAVIEGKNSITLNKTKLTSYGMGRTDDGIDNCGVMIYQSMSGDASSGTGTFSAKDSTLSISKKSSVYQSSPMFFVTNTNAVINLENTKLNYGSGTLLKVSGNDGEWGQQGSNGGTVTFNATDQTLTGNIEVDAISSVDLVLKSSTLKGTVNSQNTAKGVNISLDSTSSWNVTGDSYITTLTLENNDLSLIQDNGHTIYYDSSANSWLNGQTITLSNGGILTPAK